TRPPAFGPASHWAGQQLSHVHKGILYQAASWKTARRVVGVPLRGTVSPWGEGNRMQFAGSNEGGWVYTELGQGVRIGNSGKRAISRLGSRVSGGSMKLSAFSTLVLVLSLLAVGAHAGPISFGTADTYAVIAQTLVSNATTYGDTVITGSVGISPSGSCTGFVPVACGSAAAGTISGAININTVPAATALADAETLEGALLATVIPAPTDLTGHVLGS